MSWTKERVAKLVSEINAMGFHAYEYSHHAIYGLMVSAEHGDNAADYYNEAGHILGETTADDPWINPKLEEWAEKNGTYWEWQNAGAICCFKQ